MTKTRLFMYLPVNWKMTSETGQAEMDHLKCTKSSSRVERILADYKVWPIGSALD